MRSIPTVRRGVTRWAATTVVPAAAVAVTVLVPPQNADAATCSQPSHAFIALGVGGPVLGEGAGTATISTATNLYPTGVVKPNTEMEFNFNDTRTGALIRSHHTGIPEIPNTNCVVTHEREEFSAGLLGVRTVRITALYTRAEDDVRVARQLGTITIVAGGTGTDQFSSVDCPGQPSHVWAAVSGGPSLVEGGTTVTLPATQTLFLTGVVDFLTSVTFRFFTSNGTLALTRTTTQAGGETCVVPHEFNALPLSALAPGTYSVRAMYHRHETGTRTNPGSTVDASLGTLVIQPASGGGGGGGGCEEAQLCYIH